MNFISPNTAAQYNVENKIKIYKIYKLYREKLYKVIRKKSKLVIRTCWRCFHHLANSQEPNTTWWFALLKNYSNESHVDRQLVCFRQPSLAFIFTLLPVVFFVREAKPAGMREPDWKLLRHKPGNLHELNHDLDRWRWVSAVSLRSIRHVSSTVFKSLVAALVLSRLDYSCNCTLVGLPAYLGFGVRSPSRLRSSVPGVVR